MVAEQPPIGLRPDITAKPSFRQRADRLLRAALPCVFAVMCTLILAAPLGISGQAELLFAFLFGIVYYWSAHRPGSMPSWAVFLLGLFAELVTFGPPGAILLSLLVVHGIAYLGRYGLTRVTFVLSWLVVSVLAVLAGGFQWVLASLGAFRMLTPMPSLFQTALVIGIYPSLAAVFAWANRSIANPERA